MCCLGVPCEFVSIQALAPRTVFALLGIADSVTSHLKVTFVIVARVCLTSMFASVQIHFVLGTNGLFLALFFLMFMPKRGAGKVLH